MIGGLFQLITRTKIAINSPPPVRGQIYQLPVTFVFSYRHPAPIVWKGNNEEVEELSSRRMRLKSQIGTVYDLTMEIKVGRLVYQL